LLKTWGVKDILQVRVISGMRLNSNHSCGDDLFFVRGAVLLLLISWGGFFSCGYRLSTEVTFPGGVQQIYITIFANPTSETGIENIITDQFIAEFTRRTPGALVSRRADADAILTGVISSLKIWTVSRRGAEIPNERRVDLTVDLKLTATHGKVVWRSGSLSGSEAYSIDQTNELNTERNKQDAISAIAVKLAEKSYYRLTDTF
jgi:hypothetical protein